MIKAIDTVYNGYKFRSRLEAKWAVFFDAMSITYEYEKEGFDLDGTWYLPDFWIPDWNCWVEIKPSIIELRPSHKKNSARTDSNRELTLCRKLSDGSNKIVLLIGGSPWVKNLNTDPEVKPYFSFQYEIITFLPVSVMKTKDFNKALQETGFTLCFEDKGYFDLLDEQFYSLDKENTLYWFIKEKYKNYPSFFSKPIPAPGDVYGLIEADRLYYQNKKNENNPKWKYDLASGHYVFAYENKKFSLINELHTRDFQNEQLLGAYSAAQQKRFEQGQ